MKGPGSWAIVPVKTLEHAKQRLAGVLPLYARQRLMLVMLREVLSTLNRAELFAAVLVVTPDARAVGVAESCGALVLREAEAQGHSAAAIAGFAHAAARGAGRVVTIPADAPLVTCGELAVLTGEAVAGPHVVLAPARDGDGTNAVLAAPPEAFPPSFGPGSFARHLAAAEARGLECRVVELAGLGMDIDEPRDLRDLMERKRGDPGYAFLFGETGQLPGMALGQAKS